MTLRQADGRGRIPDPSRQAAAPDLASREEQPGQGTDDLHQLLYTRDELVNRQVFTLLPWHWALPEQTLTCLSWQAWTLAVGRFLADCCPSRRFIGRRELRLEREETPPLSEICMLRRILEEEDNLVAAHRWQIEETMAIVRQEMTLLGQVAHQHFLLLLATPSNSHFPTRAWH